MTSSIHAFSISLVSLLFTLSLRALPLSGGLCSGPRIAQVFTLWLALVPPGKTVSIEHTTLHGRENCFHSLICHIESACHIFCCDTDVTSRDIA